MLKYIQLLLFLLTVHFPLNRREEFRFPDEIARELTRRKIRKRKPKPREKIERKRKEFLHPKYRSSKPRDHRFSDHQRLRRMYRKY